MQMVKLGEISDVVRGSSPRPQGDPKYYGGDVPRLMVSDLTRDGMYVIPQIDFLTVEGAKLSRPMCKGDVVIAVSGNPGLPAILNSDACIHDGFVGLRRLDNKKLDKEYLYYFLLYNKVANNSKAVGAIFKNLTTDQIKEINVPIPDLKTQKEIAKSLEEANKARNQRKAANSLTDQFLQSIFYSMFGDPTKNEMGWEVKRLKDCVSMKGGGTPDTAVDEYYDGNIPWVSPKDMKSRFIKTSIDKISEKAIEKSSTKLIDSNCVLIVVRSGILKKTLPVGINIVPVAINQDMKALICKEPLNPFFLLFLIETLTPQILQNVRGTTADNISSDVFKNIELIIPPGSLQQQFADIVSHAELLRQKQKESQRELENLFQSLLQKYFG